LFLPFAFCLMCCLCVPSKPIGPKLERVVSSASVNLTDEDAMGSHFCQPANGHSPIQTSATQGCPGAPAIGSRLRLVIPGPPPADAAPSVPAPSAEVQNGHPAIDLDKGVWFSKKLQNYCVEARDQTCHFLHPTFSSDIQQMASSTSGPMYSSGIRMAAEAEADAWGLVWGGGPETSPDWPNRTGTRVLCSRRLCVSAPPLPLADCPRVSAESSACLLLPPPLPWSKFFHYVRSGRRVLVRRAKRRRSSAERTE
jgi:hypothetical protein